MDTAPGPAMICTMYLNKMERKWRLISPTLRLSSIINDGVFLGLSAINHTSSPVSLYVMQMRVEDQRILLQALDPTLKPPCWKSWRSFSGVFWGGYQKICLKKWSLSTYPFAAIRDSEIIFFGPKICQTPTDGQIRIRKFLRLEGFRLPSNWKCFHPLKSEKYYSSESQSGFHFLPQGSGVNICFFNETHQLVIYLMQMMDVNDVPLETLQELQIVQIQLECQVAPICIWGRCAPRKSIECPPKCPGYSKIPKASTNMLQAKCPAIDPTLFQPNKCFPTNKHGLLHWNIL